MRRSRLVLLVVATAVAVAVPAGAAAPSGLRVADLTGDANGINGQAIGLPLPATSTGAASVKGADIAGFDVVTLFKGRGKTRKAAGFTFRLRFVAPLQQGVNVSVTADASASCGGSSRLQLGYQDLGALETGLAICQSAEAGGDSTTIGITELSADQTSITWTVDAIFKPGTRLTGIDATTSGFILGVVDQASTDRAFVYGR